uniref:Carbonyl reductase n=1 Tax=Ditylenchus dipsaci TaxID=166011 RepID=A0A915EUH6_9BILA
MELETNEDDQCVGKSNGDHTHGTSKAEIGIRKLLSQIPELARHGDIRAANAIADSLSTKLNSTWKLARRMIISHSLAHRILVKDHELFPYKLHSRQELGLLHVVKRLDCCRAMKERAAKEDNRKEKGYPESVEYQSYRVSKTAEIAFSLLQSAQLRPKNIIVNACCPGSVATDMTSNKGDLTISEGADTPIYLATDPNPPNGQFIAKREIKEWL